MNRTRILKPFKDIADRLLMLPLYPQLREDQIEPVIESVLEFASGR